jgi:hypothetical protein
MVEAARPWHPGRVTATATKTMCTSAVLVLALCGCDKGSASTLGKAEAKAGTEADSGDPKAGDPKAGDPATGGKAFAKDGSVVEVVREAFELMRERGTKVAELRRELDIGIA